MSRRIDGKAVYQALNREILQLSEMIGIVLLEHADHAARTRRVDAAQTRIELGHIGALGKRQVGDSTMRVQGEYGQRPVTAAQQERAVMLGVHRHAVVAPASFDGVPADDRVLGRVDFGDFIHAAEIDVDPSSS